MKSFIALPLLAAAALAAPQLAARDDATTKPVKEADTSRADCWKKDPGQHWMLPSSPTRTEDCAGTIEYCLRGFYSLHDEDFSDADACLRSRGLDPATDVDGMRIISEDAHSRGFKALREANQIYNRYMLLTRLGQTSVSDETDKEGNDIIDKLRSSNEDRVMQAREAISDAKWFFERAYGSEHAAEIDAGIEEAKGKLNAAWNEIKDKDIEQLANMYDWFKNHSAEKYYHDW